MIRTAFYDPVQEATVRGVVGADWLVADLVEAVRGLSSGRGHPAAELNDENGSSVTLGTDGERAVLVWVDSLGQSQHSIGEDAGPAMVYDYFGSWSESPRDFLVPLSDALGAMEQFAECGSPVTECVMFQPA